MLKKIVVILLFLILVGGISLALFTNKSEIKQVDPLTYFDEFKEEQINMVYEDTRVEWDKPVIEENGEIYIDSEWIEAYGDDRVFYDEEEAILTITNVEEVIRIDTNKNTEFEIPLIKKDNKVYIGESYLEENYGFDVRKGEDGRLIVASNTEYEKPVAKVKSRKAELRVRPDKKAIIVSEVKKGHELIIFGEVENGYIRVRDENGIIGYVAEKQIKEIGKTEVKTDKVFTPKAVANPLNEKVKLVWDQMTVRIAGNWDSEKYTKIKGANVIAPTWFEFGDSEGNLIDRGHPSYVQAAKARGLQVWALMSHNFTEPQYTKEILTSTKKRQHVINQLVEMVKKYDLDGINIDIENIQPDFSREWVQFMRELYPQMQAIGATVSVDVYMPSAWSRHYERAKISEVVDYFIVMAYDQHWSGSEQAGPTAGLSWVEEGIDLNLKEVPKEKLVLGMPFFTRIWEETATGIKSKPYGMVVAQDTVKEWGVTPEYDEEHRQYYAEVTRGDTLYKVWLESSETIEERVAMIEKYGLAGYAGWKLGLEDSSVWEVLEKLK